MALARSTRSKAAVAVANLNRDYAGKPLPMPYKVGNIYIKSHTKITEFITADYLHNAYSASTITSEPNGANSFPDLVVTAYNGYETLVEVKSFIRSRNNRNENQFGVCSLAKLTESADIARSYTHAHYAVWDLYEVSGILFVGKIHLTNFASLVGYRPDGSLRAQAKRILPMNGWETRRVHYSRALRALEVSYPDLMA